MYVRNGLLFTIADWMAAPPLGDFTQLVFDPTLSLADNVRSGNFPIPLNLVVGLQPALETLGFDPNGLDGIIGPGIRTALTSFQSANGLTQTPTAQFHRSSGRRARDPPVLGSGLREPSPALRLPLGARGRSREACLYGGVSTRPTPSSRPPARLLPLRSPQRSSPSRGTNPMILNCSS
jgi:peptidoglycan hydrolase-like protein with peptidoglycan-binding domain